MAAPRRDLDWEAIERDYRAGVATLRQIAAAHGITHQAIAQRATRDGWTRDLAAKIEAKAAALIAKTAVDKEITSERLATEREIINAGAQAVAEVALSHRADIKLLRMRTQQYQQELDKCADDLSKRTAILKSLVETQCRLIAAEREAFGMDKDRPADTGLSGESVATLRKLKAIIEAQP